MKSLAIFEPLIVLFDTVLAATWVALACVVAVHAMPAQLIADSTPVQASFDIAMPALEAVDASPSLVATRD